MFEEELGEGRGELTGEIKAAGAFKQAVPEGVGGTARVA